MPSGSRRQTFLVIAFLVVVVFFVTTFRMGVVRGISMVPTYQDGQVVLVRRLHWFSPPLQRGDVVLVRQGRDVIIKRIYRLAGEEIDDSVAKVKSRALTSDLKDYYEQDPALPPPGVIPRLTVPAGYVVVLGDNLQRSEDSRVFGPLPISNILGVVVNSPPAPYANQSSQLGSGG